MLITKLKLFCRIISSCHLSPPGVMLEFPAFLEVMRLLISVRGIKSVIRILSFLTGSVHDRIFFCLSIREMLVSFSVLKLLGLILILSENCTHSLIVSKHFFFLHISKMGFTQATRSCTSLAWDLWYFPCISILPCHIFFWSHGQISWQKITCFLIN